MEAVSTSSLSEKAATRVVALVMNERSGPGCAPADLIEIFKTAGIHVHPFIVAKHGNPAVAAREAVSAHADTVVAAGGDGTISAVAGVLAGTGICLGVMPTGTFNHFAKDLRIPLDLAEAARVIADGRAEKIDVAEMNGRIFINNSSLGIYPAFAFVKERERRMGRSRFFGMLWATIRALRRMPLVGLKIHAGDVTIQRRTSILFVGNNRYEVTGLAAGSREKIVNGELFLCIANARTRFQLVHLFARALAGHVREGNDFEAMTVSEVTIEPRRKRLRVSFDGEVEKVTGPLMYRSRPGALRVIVPAPSDVVTDPAA